MDNIQIFSDETLLLGGNFLKSKQHIAKTKLAIMDEMDRIKERKRMLMGYIVITVGGSILFVVFGFLLHWFGGK